MQFLRRSSMYARHVGARTVRNARQSNAVVLVAFFGCLLILLRALLGSGYVQDETPAVVVPVGPGAAAVLSNWNPTVLERLRDRSREGIEMGWERLGRPGLGLWHEFLNKERALKHNYLSPAIQAWKSRAESRTAGSVLQEREDEDENEHRDASILEAHLLDDDTELFAPAHTYYSVGP